MHRFAVLVLVTACGRVNFGYPIVSCDEVVGTATVLGANDHCYTRHGGPATYSGAYQACGSVGGHLATFDDGTEQSYVLALPLTGPTWFGITNTSTGDPTYRWSTDEPFVFSSWAVGEPMACSNGSFGTSGVLAPDGEWMGRCTFEGYPFTCEIEPWLVSDDGHGYRIAWTPTSWLAAKVTCEQMGGYLATITSAVERTFVAPLISDGTWIGGTVSGGVISWENGESSTYTAWGANEPNEPGDGCLRTDRSHVWADNVCTGSYAALCERDP